MSEEDIQNKESSEDQEILKKKEVVEDSKDEKLVKDSEKDTPTNGIESPEKEDSKAKVSDKKENVALENSKLDKDEAMDEDDESADASKNDDSKADEAMDDSIEDSKVDESINDSNNETNDESMEESKNESLDDSKNETTVEEPLKKGSLEHPVEVKGKRERKKVERYVQETKKEEVEVEGRGTPLKEISFIQTMISKTVTEDLKFLHRLAYNRPGTAPEIKRNLYKFKGFPFTKNDKAFERKKASAEKIVLSELKKVLAILGLERSGVKKDLVERLIDFLIEPYDAGKQIPLSKRSRSRKSQGKKRSPNKNNKKKKEKSEKGEEEQSAEDSDSDAKSGSDEEKSDAEEEEEEEAEAEEEEQEDSAHDSESEEEPIKKSRKKAVKPAPKKTPQPKKTPKAQAKTTKAAKTPKTPRTSKSQPKKRPIDSDSDDSDNSSPAVEVKPKKKAKKSPTDGDIKTFIKKLLDKADLEEVTMKKLCQQVYDNYPGQDLSHKKEFIKSTVKSILS